MFERLDRYLANAEWCGVFPNTNVFNIPIMFGRLKLHFKFENW
jgi:hypothetical protein